MALVIVVLDVLDIDGLRDPRQVVDFTRVAPEMRIIDNPAQVAFEMTEVDLVKPDQRREQPDVGLGELLAQQKTS